MDIKVKSKIKLILYQVMSGRKHLQRVLKTYKLTNGKFVCFSSNYSQTFFYPKSVKKPSVLNHTQALPFLNHPKPLYFEHKSPP